jgi:glycosyltransferase involved in cell wall biosynthesis
MRILFLSLYPIDEPKHGGQLRCQGIIKVYQAQGYEVEHIGVLGSDGYAEAAGFVSYPGDVRLSAPLLGGRGNEDYAIGKLLLDDAAFFSMLAEKIKNVPDVIHVEQPWLFDFAKKYVDTLACAHDVKIIYGSQNIEHLLKKDILKSANHPNWEVLTEATRLLEIRALQQADGVLCVSRNDEEWARSNTSTPVHFAPNGIKPWSAIQEGIEAANKVSGMKKFALFCGSAHQPNVNGFATLFAGGFGALDFNQRLIVAGAAGYLISQHEVLNMSSGLSEHLVVAGMVSAECLAGLLENAHCLLLPLTQGGGTNLKTAEALWSGRHVVATSVAMRGFEEFSDSRGVAVEDSPEGFKRAIRRAMQEPPLRLTVEEKSARRAVLWDACLQKLPSFIQAIATRAS